MKIRISTGLKVLLTAILIVLLVKTLAITSCSIPFDAIQQEADTTTYGAFFLRQAR